MTGLNGLFTIFCVFTIDLFLCENKEKKQKLNGGIHMRGGNGGASAID